MENFFNNNPLADDLESWLENTTATTKTQFCENCQKLTKTIKSRESALKKLKSRIILTDKIIKQFRLKKKLGQTQQQLAFVTEKLKISEKCSQTLQSKLTGLLTTNLLKQAPKDFEQKLAAKDLTINKLEEQLKFTTSEQKIFKDSSAVSLTQTEKLRNENRRQAKVIQSLEANQKRKIQTLEKTKKEMDECKSFLAKMKKLSKSLEKEVSQLKEKNDAFFKILLDNGLLPKKELLAMNKKKNMQLISAKEVPEVDIMSDFDDDDDDDDHHHVEEKKDVKLSLTIDINSIFEEFRAFPQMLSPLPADKEGELDSSVDSSEKSDNDLAKLLELEFLGTSELPEQNADENQAKVKSVNSQNKSDLTASPASSLTNVALKPDANDKSLVEASLKPPALNMPKLDAVGRVSSAEIGSVSVSNLSDTKKEENTESPFKSNRLAPVLPNKKSSNGHCGKSSNLSSDSDSDDEELKTSSQSTRSSCVTLTKESADRKPDPSVNCTLKDLNQKILLESPELCNSQLSFGGSSSLTEKSNEQSIKEVSVGDPVRTALLDKQDHGMDHKSDPLKSSIEMSNSLNQTNADNTTSVGKDLNLCSDVIQTQLKLDMINLFGNKDPSSSSDDDDDMNSKTNEPRTSSMETNSENRTVEISLSTKVDGQNPTTIINNKSKKISLEKNDDNPISCIEGQFLKDISSLNKETTENLSVDKQLCLPIEQNTAVNKNFGDCKIARNVLPKIHEAAIDQPLEPEAVIAHPLEPEAAIEQPLEPEAAIDQPLEPEAVIAHPLEPEAVIAHLLEPEAVIEQPLKPEAAIAHPLEPEAAIEQPLEPEAAIEQPLEPKAAIDQPLEPEAVIAHPLEPEAVIAHPLEPEAVIAHPLEPEAVIAHPLEPEAVIAHPLEPEAVIAHPLEPEAVIAHPLEPEAVIEQPLKPEAVIAHPLKPEAAIEQPLEPEAAIEQPLEPEAAIEQPLEPEAAIEQPLEPETSIEQPLEPETAIEQPPEPEAVIEKPLEPEAAIEQPLEPEAAIEQPLEPEAAIDQPLEPEAAIDQPLEPEAAIDQPLEPEAAIEQPLEPEAAIEQPLEPEAAIEQPLEPEAAIEQPLEPEAAIEQPLEPEAAIEQPLEPEAAIEQPLEPEAVIAHPLEPEAVIEQPLKPEAAIDQPLEPEAAIDQPLEPEAAIEQPLEPEAAIEQPLEPEAAIEQPLEPEAAIEQPLEPEAVLVDKSCEQKEVFVVEIPPGPEAVVTKAPEPEAAVGVEKAFELEAAVGVEKALELEAVVVEKPLEPEAAVIVEKPLEPEAAVVVEKPLEPEAAVLVVVEKAPEPEAAVGVEKALEPEAVVEKSFQSETKIHLITENREETKKTEKSTLMTKNDFSFLVPVSEEFSSTVDKIRPQISEPILQNSDSCAHFLGDSLQTSITFTQSQILNQVDGDKSVDSPKTPRKQDKMILSVETNFLTKKTKVLAETDINKVDPIQLLPFQSACNEKGSRDRDRMFVATDILNLSGHEIINSSLSSDKENEMKNVSDRSIANATDPMKLNKVDTVHKQTYEDSHYLQSKSADIRDSQNMKNNKNLNGPQSLFENSKDTEGLVNDTENIPKRIGNDTIAENANSKTLKDHIEENTKTLHNFNKFLQNVEISESSKTDIEEIGTKCNRKEILSNNLENGEKQNKLCENLEKPALIKLNSINNVKKLGIDVRLSESNSDVDSLKTCDNQYLESPLILESVRENEEENSKEFKDSIVSSGNVGKSESSRNVAEEKNDSELESSSTKVEILPDSDCPKNSIKEIDGNIEYSCGLLEEGENLESLNINNVNTSCKSAMDKSKHLSVSVISEENSNNKVEVTLPLSRITSENTSVEDDHDSLNTSGDGFSLEEFSDFESPELAPVSNSNRVNNVNINELFGDDDEDQPNPESKEMVRVPEKKNPTSTLSNGSLCRVNNTDSCVKGRNEIPVPLFVNKIGEEEKDLSAVNKTKKQILSDEFGYINPRKKRKPVFRMAIAPPKRLSKVGREHAVNNDGLGNVKTKDSVIKSVKRSFIKFVATGGKPYLPTELPDTSDHDTLSPSIREEKEDDFPADHTSKNSDQLPPNSLLTSEPVIHLSENTDSLEPKNYSFSERIFARERSDENNYSKIFECIKEFILVTRPISPLPTSPVNSAQPPYDHLSSPPKKQTILQKNVSTPTTSNCDYLKDIQPFLNTIPHLSPIVTPHKLREKRNKKCLLKDFASDDGTDIASNIVPELFSKTIAADTDSMNGKSEKSCHHLLDPDSSHLPHPKSDAAESNSTSKVDSSQHSADKKCLNSQQRLLRKTRSLRRILPPTVTPQAKNARLDSTKENNRTKRKEVSKTSTTSQLPLSSSKPKTMNHPLETNPKVVEEELGVPTKKILDLLKPEKVSNVVDSDEGKKRVKSGRKRKLDVTDAPSDKDNKKQCLRNDAILSRARVSLMKVAGREFQSYWKYVSSPASQVLQKLLQTNREAELIVEVAAKQAVKLLSSTTENMLPWYITQCKSNTVTPYFSDKEKHLLRLLRLFKKRKEMCNIFTKFRSCLQEALTKETWDSTSLGKWSLCRMFLAMCRLEGLLSEARVFFYTSFCQLPCEQYITLAVITACTWPLVLCYERKDGRISLFRVIEYAVLKSLNEKPHNMKYLECLVKHCKWKPSGSSKNNDIQRSLFNHLHDCIEEGATKDEIFCYVKGVELLSFQEKWLWTVSLIRSRINHLLKKCLTLEPPEDRQQELNWLLCYIFQMLGNLCMKSKKRHKIISFVINSLLKPFLNSNKFSSEVYLCCAQVLMKLYPFEPTAAYPILELWFQETQSSEPSSKLKNEWIILKSHLNKETGVT